ISMFKNILGLVMIASLAACAPNKLWKKQEVAYSEGASEANASAPAQGQNQEQPTTQAAEGAIAQVDNTAKNLVQKRVYRVFSFNAVLETQKVDPRDDLGLARSYLEKLSAEEKNQANAK